MTVNDVDEKVMDALRALPVRDADAATTERVRRQAIHALKEERAWWSLPIRVATPVLLAGTVGVYLTWAITAAIAVYN